MSGRLHQMPFSAIEHNAGLRSIMLRRTDFYGTAHILERIVEIAQFYGEIDEYDTICCIEPYHTKAEQSLSFILNKNRTNKNEASTQNCASEKLIKRTTVLPLYNLKNHGDAYDKIILRDCANLVHDKYTCFQSMKQHIKQCDGKLIFVDRDPFWSSQENTALREIHPVNIGLKETMEVLLRTGFAVNWDLVEIPVLLPFTEWLEEIRESHRRYQKSGEVLGGFLHDAARLISGPLKYTTWDETECVSLRQPVFVIVASPQIPPGSEQLSIRRFAFSFNGSSNQTEDLSNKKRKCTLKLTPEMQQYAGETLSQMIQHSFGCPDWTKQNRKAEWWGTVNAEKWISMDSSRIPRKRLNFFAK
ncbi:hypothetical protein FGIG_01958 [Fasciola gigantica]|uniref:Uncharacterized protein n=1 Tax=Fasciola gigantica TaxID=46835 RepID=A0A504YA69_FASGI|nr:hypothetical protein FGIG_01958 [Fasciola gigantica]